MIDYKGFWSDFTIADKFGIEAIKDTYRRCQEWKGNVEYFTALVITLNHKIWWHYEHDNTEYANLYDELWREADEWALNNFKGKDLDYYLQTTDQYH